MPIQPQPQKSSSSALPSFPPPSVPYLFTNSRQNQPQNYFWRGDSQDPATSQQQIKASADSPSPTHPLLINMSRPMSVPGSSDPAPPAFLQSNTQQTRENGNSPLMRGDTTQRDISSLSPPLLPPHSASFAAAPAYPPPDPPPPPPPAPPPMPPSMLSSNSGDGQPSSNNFPPTSLPHSNSRRANQASFAEGNKQQFSLLFTCSRHLLYRLRTHITPEPFSPLPNDVASIIK
jgi:Wiskott-Aldrich syndrome protein